MKVPNQPGLRKYLIGLGALMVFVVVLVVMVLVQAGGFKEDTKTYKAADAASQKLNDYVSSNQTIPSSLDEAGVKDVPSSISYTKLSSSKYKFCATYNSDSNGFDTAAVESDILTAQTGGTASSDTFTGSSSNYDLYISPTHHKGANCQTVEPYIYGGGGGGCTYPQNDSSDQAFNNYYDCIYNQDNGSSSSSSDSPTVLSN